MVHARETGCLDAGQLQYKATNQQSTNRRTTLSNSNLLRRISVTHVVVCWASSFLPRTRVGRAPASLRTTFLGRLPRPSNSTRSATDNEIDHARRNLGSGPIGREDLRRDPRGRLANRVRRKTRVVLLYILIVFIYARRMHLHTSMLPLLYICWCVLPARSANLAKDIRRSCACLLRLIHVFNGRLCCRRPVCISASPACLKVDSRYSSRFAYAYGRQTSWMYPTSADAACSAFSENCLGYGCKHLRPVFFVPALQSLDTNCSFAS